MATVAEEIAIVLEQLDNFINTSDLETLSNLVNSPKVGSKPSVGDSRHHNIH